VPAGLVPVLGALRVGLGFVFLSIEDQATRTPIATIIEQKPRAARVYPLTMDVEGFGWVVFGPRAAQGPVYYNGEISVELDPETYTALKTTAPVFGLSINGFVKELSNVLELSAQSAFLTISVEGGVIYIDRNDDVFTEDDRSALTQQPEAPTIPDQALLSIDGVLPDENGNIDIDIIGCIEGCQDNRELLIPRGDTGRGISEKLPLDIFNPRVYNPDDPCDPDGGDSSTGDSSEAEDPFAGCTEIGKTDILDASDGDRPIGTLYTASSLLP